MKLNKTADFVASKVPSLMKEYIVNSVNIGHYISISDFVRAAIKEKLEREGYLSPKSKAEVDLP